MADMAVMEPPPVTHPVQIDHLSFSSLKMYQTCPRKFAFKYIEQVPEEFKPSSLAFGSAFHTAVESVQQARLQGSTVPALENLMAVFDAAWSRETKGQEVQFCKDEDVVSLHDLASRMLDAYSAYASLEATLPETGQVISIEHANRFRLLAEVPPIESHVDLL